ncbi:MAG: NAD(P)/FAD-dependent oxidoreductase, partial [Cetobacterium sp.]
APETRTSAPVKITRNEFGESINVKGLFPVGEGAGYAGGIISAAVDGMKVVDLAFTTIVE